MSSNNMTRDVIFGIDPSWITMGVARYVPETQDLILFSGDFDTCLEWMCQFDLSRAVGVVESPDLDGNSFGAWFIVKNCITQIMRGKMTFELARQQISSQFKKSRNVGENAAAANYIIKKLKDCGIPVAEIAPSQRKKAVVEKDGKVVHRLDARLIPMPTKTNAEQFEKLTGYPRKKGNNEHSRDGATLVWNKSISWVYDMIIANKVKREQEEAKKKLKRAQRKASKRKS